MQQLPYCGAPPIPADLWQRWNFDPWLLSAFAVVAAAVFYASKRYGFLPTASQRFQFTAGMGLALISFVSPLCALSMALFSARSAQHLILVLAAAPLLSAAIKSRQTSESASARSMGMAFGAFTLLFLGVAPARPYAATLASSLVYWLMNVSLFASAVWLWREVMADKQQNPLAIIIAFGTAVQMSLLSGLLFFSTAPWHAWHETTTWAWALSPMEDQILAALFMWVPGSAVFAAIALMAIAKVVNQQENTAFNIRHANRQSFEQ